MTAQPLPVPQPQPSPRRNPLGGGGGGGSPTGGGRSRRDRFRESWQLFFTTFGAVVASRSRARGATRLGDAGTAVANGCRELAGDDWFGPAIESLYDEDEIAIDCLETELRFFIWRFQGVEGAASPTAVDPGGDGDYGPPDGDDVEGAESGAEIVGSISNFLKRFIPERFHNRFDSLIELAKLLRPV